MGFGWIWIWSEIDQSCSGLDTVLDTPLFRAGFAKLVDGTFHVSRFTLRSGGTNTNPGRWAHLSFETPASLPLTKIWNMV